MEDKKTKELKPKDQAPSSQGRKMKVTQLTAHAAVQVALGTVVNGFGSKPEHAKFKMEMHPAGVLIVDPNGTDWSIVPYGNLQIFRGKFEE